MPTPVSFARDILPLFRQEDIDCMARMNVLLNNYEWMSTPANAQNVRNHLTGDTQPRMPMGGPYWSQDQLELLRRWMTEEPGYQP